MRRKMRYMLEQRRRSSRRHRLHNNSKKVELPVVGPNLLRCRRNSRMKMKRKMKMVVRKYRSVQSCGVCWSASFERGKRAL